MLQLVGIKKDYVAGDSVVNALKGVTINFRGSEFVSILGQSGCGKTTLLNIVGGLDKYTEGDLIINGKTTKEYKDRDWDTYRNHTIGFVFQSYNLIPHESVLGNVELALTLSGMPKAERRKKAEEALKRVGLETQLNKKPNQLSGGQMQRVAIARAIVNDPDIILADEPTGALDTETSVQVMDILKNIAKEKLVIMVTHNPQLADKYSTRIIRLLDGELISDTNPFDGEEKAQAENILLGQMEKEKASVLAQSQGKKVKMKGKKKPSMSFLTALSLSVKNMFTKKARTFLTAFAGSIGIIGIALVLSLSAGFQNYIKQVEEETLSTYPISIESESMDIESLMDNMTGGKPGTRPEEYPDGSEAGIRDVLSQIKQMQSMYTNDLKSLKQFLESEEGKAKLEGLCSDIKYSYNIDLNIFKNDYTENNFTQLNPFKLPADIFGSGGGMAGEMMNQQMQMMLKNLVIWDEMLSNQKLIESQYELLDGNFPKEKDEIVIVLDKYNRIDDYTLFSLGLLSPMELKDLRDGKFQPKAQSFSDLMTLKFKLTLGADMYGLKSGSQTVWESKAQTASRDTAFMNELLSNSLELKVAGIIRPKKDSVATSIRGTIGYLPSLTKYVVETTAQKDFDIVKAQKSNPMLNVLTGLPFDMTSMNSQESYTANMKAFSSAELDTPSMISIYPVGFNEKDGIISAIKDYNDNAEEGKQIKYTDMVGLMMSSVSTIINAITYVLVAFIAISLVVSSIMIGIITYISVLERTKEIGVLRSIGASKRDISNVFNAETLIIGFAAGMLGIIVTIILNIPITIIIRTLAGISAAAALPWFGGIILVAISMLLTFIAGLIPSRIAAKKDPVIALRTE